MPRERTPGATLMGPNDLRTNRPRTAGAAPSREQSGTPGGEPGAVLRLPLSGEHNRADEEGHPDHETSNDGHGGDPPPHGVSTERPGTTTAVRMPARGVAGSSVAHQWHFHPPDALP